MKLSSHLANDFSGQTRARGSDYYRAGWVRIERGSDTGVEASVEGARSYAVEIVYNGRTLTLCCDCPYFDSNGPCKHLWATILAAESQGHLSAAANVANGNVIYDFPNDYGDTDESEQPRHTVPAKPAVWPPLPPPPPKPPAWRLKLNEIGAESSHNHESWPATRELLYVVDVPASLSRGLIVKMMTREPRQAGGWKKPQVPRLLRSALSMLPDPVDRRILGLLSGASGHYEWSATGPYEVLGASYRVLHPLSAEVMPLMAQSGRCLLQTDVYGKDLVPVAWDDGEPWRFQVRLQKRGKGQWAIVGMLSRDAEQMDLATPLLLTPGGLVFTRERVARLDENASFQWISQLRKSGAIMAPEADIGELIAAVLEHPLGVELQVPEELRFEEVRATPRPCLIVRGPSGEPLPYERLRADLMFDYEGRRVSGLTHGRAICDTAARKYLLRDTQAEQAARGHLQALGVTGPSQDWNEKEPSWRVAPKRLPVVVRACLEAGWHIEAEGKVFRRPGSMRAEVSSGVDWFELNGEVEYGDTSVKLPVLLAALRRGEGMVRLDDGTYGLLPEEWLRRFGTLVSLGDAGKESVRFGRNQVGLLDALLATQPEIRFDETFARMREEIRSFAGIQAAAQPAGFVGHLRDYQRDGVGWMDFLRRFGFGGCLADDMGVGKTAQVLAMLEERRAAGAAGGLPSLVVVPKSLVFNWKQEAARFTPRLRVLDHTGATRSSRGFAEHDLVLTTYGTLRRDAAMFKDIEFDYVVLDEAQAIKNAATESAKAARLLRGRHRLALSGTPVENHLGELWSLFEFLNPGMLGAAGVFKLAGSAGRNPDDETRKLLAHALRPFFLRRTKEQVARELPPKSEQTILCEMDAAERKRYNELRAFYRNSLLHTIETQGLAKSKIQVLEALLRLRQAACHPGLLDSKRLQDSSAKLEVLLTHLSELAAEGHKALVFSQFTSLLAIVRKRLDEQGTPYEYLDGATNNRQEHVERFQTDPDCGLFLISLKAGGLGLNLTAAEYIFLLDPWWNPAVEAQAIDRAHRIGQTKPVFAYRLIARDTVEEKVLQLQKTKRDLAAAIISEDNSVLRNLKREDLELLLS